MKRMTGLALFCSLLALSSTALAGAPTEPKLINKDGILRVYQREGDHGTKSEGRLYNYLMKIDVHFGLNFLTPNDPAVVGVPGKNFSLLPTCYHHGHSPIGVVMHTLKDAPPYAVVGMHVGTMAAYAKPNQEVHFFESNPKIIGLSLPKKGNPYFTYIQDATKRGANVKVFQGKERETIAEKAPKNHYQVISVEMCLRSRLDDICVEFMTKEGMSLLMDKLKENGFLCYHISNRYFDMTPVLADVAKDLGLVIRHSNDTAPDADLGGVAHFSSEWVIVARHQATLDKLQPPPGYGEAIKAIVAKKPYMANYFNKPFWDEPQPTGKFVWTDKSKHTIKGLLRSDPTMSRMANLYSGFTSQLQKAYGKESDPQTAKSLSEFRSQITNLIRGLGTVTTYWREEAGQTVEDLQKGWPPGY